MNNNKINKRWKWIKIIKKTKNNKKWEEDLNQDLKMRYFKIPLCRNFVRKVGDYSDRMTRVSGVLGQKLGYDIEELENTKKRKLKFFKKIEFKIKIRERN